MKTVLLLFLALIIKSTHEIDMITIINPGEKVEFVMGCTEEELKLQPHRDNDPDYYYTDERAHKVKLTVPYAIGKYEITNIQFVSIMNYGLNKKIVQLREGDLYDIYNRKLLGIEHLIDHRYLGVQYGIKIRGNQLETILGREKWPVHAVTWIGAITFCNILSEIEDLEPAYDLKELSWDESKNGYRLPTEAEWEYAARGNKRYIWAWGNRFTPQHCCSSEFNDSTGWTYHFTPVGFFDGSIRNGFKTIDNSSPFGIYDMTGNVWEWCWDWYSKTYYENSPELNPYGPEIGKTRPPYDMTEPTKVWRGCAWMGTKEYSRITKRWSSSIEIALNETGFRVARTISIEKNKLTFSGNTYRIL